MARFWARAWARAWALTALKLKTSVNFWSLKEELAKVVRAEVGLVSNGLLEVGLLENSVRFSLRVCNSVIFIPLTASNFNPRPLARAWALSSVKTSFNFWSITEGSAKAARAVASLF